MPKEGIVLSLPLLGQGGQMINAKIIGLDPKPGPETNNTKTDLQPGHNGPIPQ